jgi:hypothetical protein
VRKVNANEGTGFKSFRSRPVKFVSKLRRTNQGSQASQKKGILDEGNNSNWVTEEGRSVPGVGVVGRVAVRKEIDWEL